MELKGCAAIVTGGSGGLGQRICRALALNGVNVVVNYAESETKAKSVVEDIVKLGVRAVALRADVTDPAAVSRMVEQAKAEFGRVDILVNDAAFNKEVAFPDLDSLTLELWNHILDDQSDGHVQLHQGRRAVDEGPGPGPDHQHILRGGPRPARQQHRLRRLQGGHDPSHQVHGRGARSGRDGELHCAWLHGGNAHERQLVGRIRGHSCRQDAPAPNSGQGRCGRAADNVLPQRQRHGPNGLDGLRPSIGTLTPYMRG